MEPFPSSWRDTPQNRQRWARLQNAYDFLYQEQSKNGYLSCHYCGKAPLRIVHWTEPQRAVIDKATVDHVNPLARGGADHPSNMVVSCEPCNAAKGDKVFR